MEVPYRPAKDSKRLRRRGAEAMDNSYDLLDLTVHGRPGDVGGLADRLATTVKTSAMPAD
jgi:predicted dithiol-disulfide oxidoreductase (DUF899 family)